MKTKIASAAAALLWAALVLPAAADLSGPRKGYDPTNNTFVDVKSEPLATSDLFTTTWVFHASSLAGTGRYSGFLFNLSYDGHELSDLKLAPVAPHVALEEPGGGLVSVVTFPGSQSSPQMVGPIAAYIDPGIIADSGTLLGRSDLVAIFQLQGHAKNTHLTNSDIDITIEPWIIRHLLVDTPTRIPLPASAWVYETVNGGSARPGEGFWRHLPNGGTVTLGNSALVALQGSPDNGGVIQNAAGFGIEHVPEPAALALLALGAGALAIGRWRQRRA